MESSDLRIFQKVAELKSVTRAAQALHFVQPHVTGRIKRLETQLQTDLFERCPTGMALTPDGEVLLFYAQRILSLLEQAEAEFRKNTGELRIGAPQTLAASRLPAWLSSFREQSPSVKISLTTAPSEELLSLLKKGRLDCAFLQTDAADNVLQNLVCFTEKLCVAIPASCDESSMLSLPVLVNCVASCPYRKLLTEWYLRSASTLPDVVELDTVEAMLHSVALGLGITLLPAACIPKQQTDIAAITIPGLKEMTCRLATPRTMRNEAVFDFSTVVRCALESG